MKCPNCDARLWGDGKYCLNCQKSMPVRLVTPNIEEIFKGDHWWVDGGEFDNLFGEAMNAGFWRPSVRYGYGNKAFEKVVIVGQCDDYCWNTSNGDPIDDFTRIKFFLNTEMGLRNNWDTIRAMRITMSKEIYGALQQWGVRPDLLFPCPVTLNYIETEIKTINIGGTSTGAGVILMELLDLDIKIIYGGMWEL